MAPGKLTGTKWVRPCARDLFFCTPSCHLIRGSSFFGVAMKLCGLAVWLLLGSSLWAQETPAVVSPEVKSSAGSPNQISRRIGLVLEGGGRLGLAHVGWTRWRLGHSCA